VLDPEERGPFQLADQTSSGTPQGGKEEAKRLSGYRYHEN
jgi:hypothetical protein